MGSKDFKRIEIGRKGKREENMQRARGRRRKEGEGREGGRKEGKEREGRKRSVE